MKLNPDCVRDVLLAVERCQQIELTPRGGIITKPLKMKDAISVLPNHLTEDIVYSVIILNEAGYIEASITSADSVIANFSIFRLTYKGHEFLDDIRDGKIWAGIKEGASVVGSFGLNTISDIAKGLIGAAVTGFLTRA